MRYKNAGISIVLGADQGNSTLTEEIDDIISLGVFSNLELLNIISQNTPKLIFPNRKIGSIKDGYEASFLVLEGNPIKDITNIKKISMRVKNGIVL